MRRKGTSLLKCYVSVIKLGESLICRPVMSRESFLFLLGTLMNRDYGSVPFHRN